MTIQKTPNLKMNKWDPKDPLQREEWNENFQIIDDATKDIITELADTAKQLTDIAINISNFPLQAPETDDTARIQRAIESIKMVGGTIFLVDHYTISSSLLLYRNVRLMGVSKETTVVTTSVDITMIKSNNPAGRIDNTGISKMTFKRNPGNTTTPMLDFTGVSHSDFNDFSAQQYTNKGESIGVKFGAFSYYNNVINVQVRGCKEGIAFYDEANRNTVIGGAAVSCDIGFVIDHSNSNKIISSAELCSEVGFLLRNGSKHNSLLGSSAEAMPIGFRAEYNPSAPFGSAFDNYFIGCLSFATEKNFDMQTTNVLINTQDWYKIRYPSVRPSFTAYKNSSQASLPTATWKKVDFQSKLFDKVNNFDTLTGVFTVAESGLYQINSFLTFTNGSDGNKMRVGVYKNGVLFHILGEQVVGGAVGVGAGGGCILDLVSTDTIEIYAFSQAASTGIASGSSSSYFSALKIV